MKKINLSDKVEVVGMKGASFLVPGKVYAVHPVHAERLVNNKEAELKKDK